MVDGPCSVDRGAAHGSAVQVDAGRGARGGYMYPSSGGFTQTNPEIGLTYVLRLLRLLSRSGPLRPLHLGFLSHPEPS